MSVLNDIISTSISTGVGAALEITGVKPADLGKGLKLVGKTMIDLGQAVEDGKISSDEIDVLLTDAESFQGGSAALAVKSAVNRIIEQYTR